MPVPDSTGGTNALTASSTANASDVATTREAVPLFAKKNTHIPRTRFLPRTRGSSLYPVSPTSWLEPPTVLVSVDTRSSWSSSCTSAEHLLHLCHSTELTKKRRKNATCTGTALIPSIGPLQEKTYDGDRHGRMRSNALATNTARPRASSNDFTWTYLEPSVCLAHLTNQEAPRSLTFLARSRTPPMRWSWPPAVFFHDSGPHHDGAQEEDDDRGTHLDEASANSSRTVLSSTGSASQSRMLPGSSKNKQRTPRNIPQRWQPSMCLSALWIGTCLCASFGVRREAERGF